MKKVSIFLSIFLLTVAIASAQTVVCNPPTHYRHSIKPGESTPISCAVPHGSYNTLIEEYTFPQADIISPSNPALWNSSGYTLAQVRITFRNNATILPGLPSWQQLTNGVYTWGLAMEIGNNTYSTAEAMCPQTTSPSEPFVSYGYKQPGGVLRIKAHAVRSLCEDGKVAAFGGGVLDVWVEDPRPECQKKDVIFSTTNGSAGFGTEWTDSAGVTVGWVWQPSPSSTNLVKTKINSAILPPTNAPRSLVRVLGSVEGSPRNTPAIQCGFSKPIAGAELQEEGTQNVLASTQQELPTAQHMGHFNLGLLSSTTQDVLTGKTFGMYVYTTASASNRILNPTDESGVDVFTGSGKGYSNIGIIRE